jgi:hypothetical protein
MDTKDIFLNRDRSFIKLTEAGDYLGRVLRENLVIFDVDSSDNSVTYLSESQKLVSCDYSLNENGKVIIDVVAVGEASDIFDDSKIDALVSEGVSEFVKNLSNTEFDEADKSFDSVLDAFRMRNRINETRYELNNKLSRFTEDTVVRDTTEFAKLHELKEKIVEFMDSSFQDLHESTDVVTAVRIGNAIQKTTNAPKEDYESIVGKSFTATSNDSTDLYEMVCRQELISREIMESKKNFSDIWASHTAMSDLASCIFSDEDTIHKMVMEAIQEIPYLALASKGNISDALTSIYEINGTENISKKNIKEFVSTIFEIKKPVKTRIVEGLNRKYGININSLKFVPSFGSLADQHSDLFESLSELTDSPVLAETFKEFSNFIKGKKGVEVLEVNDFILECLSEAGIGVGGEEDFLTEAFSLQNLSEEIVEEEKKKKKEEDKKKKEEDKKKKEEDKEKKEDKKEDEDLDPVGEEDEDVDNDGDVDSSDKYLKKRRKAIGKAMNEAAEEVEQQEEEAAEEEDTQDSEEDVPMEEPVDDEKLKSMVSEFVDALEGLDLDKMKDAVTEEEDAEASEEER